MSTNIKDIQIDLNKLRRSKPPYKYPEVSNNIHNDNLVLPQTIGRKTYYTKEQIVQDLEKLQQLTALFIELSMK